MALTVCPHHSPPSTSPGCDRCATAARRDAHPCYPTQCSTSAGAASPYTDWSANTSVSIHSHSTAHSITSAVPRRACAACVTSASSPPRDTLPSHTCYPRREFACGGACAASRRSPRILQVYSDGGHSDAQGARAVHEPCDDCPGVQGARVHRSPPHASLAPRALIESRRYKSQGPTPALPLNSRVVSHFPVPAFPLVRLVSVHWDPTISL